jgi:hypothetical protein
LEELVAEARAVIDAQQYDIPGQGKLFLENSRRGKASADDVAEPAAKPAKGSRKSDAAKSAGGPPGQSAPDELAALPAEPAVQPARPERAKAGRALAGENGVLDPVPLSPD